MKLKCVAHDRRVMTVNGHFEHRTGDMSKCETDRAYLPLLGDPWMKTFFQISTSGYLVKIV